MPCKPKRPCAYPGCPELTDGRYCAEHQKIITAHYNRLNATRPAASDTGALGNGYATAISPSTRYANNASATGN